MPTTLGDGPVLFRLSAYALWLMGFGLAPAVLACALSKDEARAVGRNFRRVFAVLEP
ncbi:MAG: hypothetical protein J0H34_16150 [Rhizobiales bacterium]|nr:hypothetical protein [Hyphomicrobiales bacterium]